MFLPISRSILPRRGAGRPQLLPLAALQQQQQHPLSFWFSTTAPSGKEPYLPPPPPEAPAGGNTIKNPFTGQAIATWPYESPEAALARVNAAHAAFGQWRGVPLSDRIFHVKTGAEALEAGGTALAFAIVNATGKLLRDARWEVAEAARRARQLADLAPTALAPESRERAAGGGHLEVRREPLGVVDVVCPWNYPLLTAVNAAIPAILAGNTVVLKHESVPVAGDAMQDAWGTFRSPRGDGDVAGLVSHLSIDVATSTWLATTSDAIQHRVFTGSTKSGRAVAAAAGARANDESLGAPFLSLSLELGGSDAAYIHGDVPAGVVAKVARQVAMTGRLPNAGQSCSATKRLIVHPTHYEAACTAIAEAFAAQKIGDPSDSATTVGPLYRGMVGCAELFAQVLDAQSKGASVVVGGEDVTAAGVGDLQEIVLHQIEQGWFFAPTMLLGCGPGMAAWEEETFGPLLAVATAGSVAEAAAMATAAGGGDGTGSKFGLTASIWTDNGAAADEFSAACDVGTVYVNRCNMQGAGAPWTGRGWSGNGASSLGIEGFRSLTRAKAVLRSPLPSA